MRTTIDLNDQLLRQAKARAAQEDTTLKDIIAVALRQYLEPTHRDLPPLKWEVTHGRMLPGVNLESRDALYELLDGDELRDRYRH